jgi:restriction system protein
LLLGNEKNGLISDGPMTAENIVHHYPPELLSLLVDTIPLLCRSKKDVITFFHGAGVGTAITSDYQRKVATTPAAVNKYEIVREVLIRLNDRGERTLRERREILKRVTEYEDYSTCWPADQLKAKGLVAEIRRVVDVKDSFGRMRQQQEAERKQRLDEEKKKAAAITERRRNLENIKKDLYALFGESNPQRRGKHLEDVLNRLFRAAGISIREAFVRVSPTGEGVIEQIDGVIELDGEIYLVEMKWWEKPLGNAEVSQHLVRVFTRHCARGLLISYSSYTGPAIAICRDALAQMVVVLCDLKEIVQLLEREGDLRELLRAKIQAAVVDKNPFHLISG